MISALPGAIFVPGIQPSDLQEAGVTLQDCHVIIFAADVGRWHQNEAQEAFEVVCSLRTTHLGASWRLAVGLWPTARARHASSCKRAS